MMSLFSLSPDGARYEGSVRLANLTTLRDNMAAMEPARTLQNILEKQARFFSLHILRIGYYIKVDLKVTEHKLT